MGSEHPIFGFLYFQLDTLFFRVRTISAILFPLHISGLTGPSSGGLNCTCSLWYSPPENGIVYRHYIKILTRVSSYRLLGIFVCSYVMKRVEVTFVPICTKVIMTIFYLAQYF